MKTTWDYTALAEAYLKRADYAPAAIDEILRCAHLRVGDRVCDIGAGAAHLTLPLVQRGMHVTAIEPNDARRANGTKRTATFSTVNWFEGTGEQSGQQDGAFGLVTFGSSFGVTDRALALREAARILRPHGWFACLYNHRDLYDPTQAAIEAIIKRHIPNYDYGSRREDQTGAIDASGLFGPVRRIEAPILHEQSVTDALEAWRSHATLHRQAANAFPLIIEEIGEFLQKLGKPTIIVPYVTRAWVAERR